VSPCVESDWPLDPEWRIDDPRRARRLPFAWLTLAVVVILIVCLVAALAGRLLPRRTTEARGAELNRAPAEYPLWS
jgi:hypothetical protein